jgi:hypothetical protein
LNFGANEHIIRNMKIHLDKVQDVAGFATGNAEKGGQVKVLARASIASDQPEFYTDVDQISN